MPDYRPGQPVPTEPKPVTPSQGGVRLTPPTPIGNRPRIGTGSTSTIRLTPVGPKKPKEKKKSFWDKVFAFPSSAGERIWQGVTAVPMVAVKGGQEIGGWLEEGFNVATDIIDEDLYTSRFETDYRRGEEMGLQGDELWAYATQRTMPLSTPMLQGMKTTAERISELGSGGLIKSGEPGIDYLNAFNRGDLGGVVVDDLGNIILAGRLSGAGNVLARSGEAIAAGGRPELGRAVSSTGRFIEEPIGTTVRGVSREVGASLPTTGRVGSLKDPFERIGLAERPLRQAYNEIGQATKALKERNIERYTTQINVLEAKARDAQRTGDMETAANIQAEINDLKQKRNRAAQGTEAGATVRRLIGKGKTIEERMRQTVIGSFRNLQKQGPAPESVDTYRARAARLRKRAEKATDQATRDRLNTQAEANENLATIKEQYPEFLTGEMPAWVNEAVIHFGSKKARELAADEANGATMAELIEAATDPYVDPSIAEKGMLPTEEGVRAAIEYVKYIDGKPHGLNAAEVLALNAFYAQYLELSRLMTENMRAGLGMPEGPAPFYWFQTYPIPQNLLAALELVDDATRRGVLEQLDKATIQVIADLYRQALLDPEFFDDYGIDAQQIAELGYQPGLFESLTKQGLKELQDGVERPPAYMIAFTASQFSYKRLQQIAPSLMLNPDIYPAIMRPAIITRRQRVRQVTGGEVLSLADQLQNIARDNPDLLSQSQLDAITGDIRDALDPQKRGEQVTLNRLLKRIETINRNAVTRLQELRKRSEELNAEEKALATELFEVSQRLGAVEATLRTMAAQPPEPSPRLVGAQQRVADAEVETQALLSERERLLGEDQATREAESARLQPLRDQLAAEDARMADNVAQERTARDELGQVERDQQQIEQELSLLATALENPEALQADFELVVELQGAADTAADARALRAERIATAQADVDTLKAELEDLMGPEKLKSRGDRIDPQTGKRINEGTLAQEDVAAALWPLGGPRSPAYRAFVREYVGPDGLALDELSSTDRAASRNLYGDDSAFLTTVAQTFAQMYEARQRVKEARKSAEQYRGEVLERDLLADPVTGEPLGQTGLSSQQVLRAVELQDAVELNALLDRQKQTNKRAADLRNRLDSLASERARIAEDAGLARGAFPEEQVSANRPRLAQISARLGELRAEQRNALRSLRFAERAEPKEGARAQAAGERAQLRGVGRIRRPAPGAEGPALGEVQAGARAFLEAETAQLNKRQERNVARLKQVRRAIREQEALAEQATGPAMLESQRMRTEADYGPALLPEGEVPLYLPAGPARGMQPGEPFDLTLRGEGAAPETTLQATKQRTTGAMLLTAEGMAARIEEVLGQQYRNSVIQMILADPTATSDVGTILSLELLDRMLAESEQRAQNQNIPRNTPEFQQAVQRDFGTRVIEELRKRGYEAVSPVRVDPETGSRAAVGDLTLQVKPNNIDANTMVMRYGLRERIVSQYERTGATEAPTFLGRTWDNLGKLTGKWKSHVLPLSFRWQMGDAVGIVLFAWTRGDIPPGQLWRRFKEVTEMMKDPNDPRLASILFGDTLGNPFSDPVLAALFASGLAGRGLRMEETFFRDAFNERVAGQRRLGSDRTISKPYNWVRTKGFRLNEAINSMGRAAVALENLDRILREQGRSLDEITAPNSIGDPVIAKAINEAVDITNETLGAFSELTPWEKRTMRNIYPFWSWLKFINKAALELAVDNPDRVLFYAHLGSMATEDDNMGLSDWLAGKTPMVGDLWDFSFMNPYADALIFAKNPLVDATETLTGVSPALTTPLKIGGELTYGFTGRRFPLFDVVSRPSYLEGAREAGERGIGDTLGGAAYLGVKGLVPIARNVFDILPTGTIPGTDIATGPVQRFGQGSLRTTGAYAEPRLSPTKGRLSALLRTFGIPAPLISIDLANKQAEEQRQRDEAARQRRIKERQTARG